MAASVKDRLLQIARTQQEELQSLLTRYAIERFLYRLSQTEYHQCFILKGANVFALWLGATHRPTRDVDFLGYGSDEIEQVIKVFRAICREPVAVQNNAGLNALWQHDSLSWEHREPNVS